MKKTLISLSLLTAAAASLQAGTIINGDFSSNSYTSTASGLADTNANDSGWFVYDPDSWTISGGALSRNATVNPGSQRGAAQLWENDTDNWYASSPTSPATGASNFTLGAGSYNLNLTYDFNDVLDDDTLTVQLFSWDYIDGTYKAFQSANTIATSNLLTTPSTQDRYTVTTLLNTTLVETTGSSSVNIGFTLAAGQEFMGIRIASTTDVGDTVSFTNIDITPVPEPSTYALIAGLGVVGLLAIRRRK